MGLKANYYHIAQLELKASILPKYSDLWLVVQEEINDIKSDTANLNHDMQIRMGDIDHLDQCNWIVAAIN